MVSFSDIREDQTQSALFTINTSSDLYEVFREIKNKHQSLKKNSMECLNVAEDYAKKHENGFGDLFITELEMVKWNKVLKSIV